MDVKSESGLLPTSNNQSSEIDLFVDGINNLDNGDGAELKPDTEVVSDNLKPNSGLEHQNLAEIPQQLIKLRSEVMRLTVELNLAQKTIEERDIELAETKLELAKTKKEVYISHLTKVPNRKYFDEIFKVEKFDPNFDRNKIALVYVDINGLKKINDTPESQGGGHDAGDKLIKNITEFLKKQFREEDTIIHLHGDEFVVICRDRKDGIDEESLRTRVNEIINLALDNVPPLKFAAGVAVFDDKPHGRKNKIDSNLDDTKIRAEQEMYRVKAEMKAGRQERVIRGYRLKPYPFANKR
jgi:diguanylate cyclase (GGDEF)-like protein